MAEHKVMIQLPSGEVKTVALPDDVSVRELLPELVTTLGVPVTGPDGRPMSYRLDSKALGRSIREDETLEEAAVPLDDRLVLSPIVVAGAARARS
jgi:hypothetical protein